MHAVIKTQLYYSVISMNYTPSIVTVVIFVTMQHVFSFLTQFDMPSYSLNIYVKRQSLLGIWA